MCTRTVVIITIGSKNIFFQFCKDFEKATNLFSFNYEFVILCTIRIPHTKCWPNFSLGPNPDPNYFISEPHPCWKLLIFILKNAEYLTLCFKYVLNSVHSCLSAVNVHCAHMSASCQCALCAYVCQLSMYNVRMSVSYQCALCACVCQLSMCNVLMSVSCQCAMCSCLSAVNVNCARLSVSCQCALCAHVCQPACLIGHLAVNLPNIINCLQSSQTNYSVWCLASCRFLFIPVLVCS